MSAGDAKWYRVSLRLMGDALPIHKLETLLGITPAHIGRKGEHIKANPKYTKYATNIWVWECSANSDVPFEEQITEMLRRLKPKQAELEQLLALEGIEGELFLGFSCEDGQGGAELSANLLKQIAEFGLSISLDLYPPPHNQSD